MVESIRIERFREALNDSVYPTNLIAILSIVSLAYSAPALAEGHLQGNPFQFRGPTELRVESTGNRTFRVLADGTRVDITGTIPSGDSKGGSLTLQAHPEQCEIRFDGKRSKGTVTGLVGLQARSIPIQIHGRGLNGKTDSVNKVILGGNVGVYGLINEIDFTGTLAIAKAEASISGSLAQGITATIVIEGSAQGTVVGRGSTESWVKHSRRSVSQTGYFDVAQATFLDSFAIKLSCVNSKLQTSIPLSYPQVAVNAKVNLGKTALNPMFGIGQRFPNASASIRSNLLVKFEPVINQKLNAKIRNLTGEKSEAYLQLKRELVLKLLSSEWLEEARKACACGTLSPLGAQQ